MDIGGFQGYFCCSMSESIRHSCFFMTWSWNGVTKALPNKRLTTELSDAITPNLPLVHIEPSQAGREPSTLNSTLILRVEDGPRSCAAAMDWLRRGCCPKNDPKLIVTLGVQRAPPYLGDCIRKGQPMFDCMWWSMIMWRQLLRWRAHNLPLMLIVLKLMMMTTQWSPWRTMMSVNSIDMQYW